MYDMLDKSKGDGSKETDPSILSKITLGKRLNNSSLKSGPKIKISKSRIKNKEVENRVKSVHKKKANS